VVPSFQGRESDLLSKDEAGTLMHLSAAQGPHEASLAPDLSRPTTTSSMLVCTNRKHLDQSIQLKVQVLLVIIVLSSRYTAVELGLCVVLFDRESLLAC